MSDKIGTTKLPVKLKGQVAKTTQTPAQSPALEQPPVGEKKEDQFSLAFVTKFQNKKLPVQDNADQEYANTVSLLGSKRAGSISSQATSLDALSLSTSYVSSFQNKIDYTSFGISGTSGATTLEQGVSDTRGKNSSVWQNQLANYGANQAKFYSVVIS